MVWYALSFLAGIVCLNLFSTLPGVYWGIGIFVFGGVCAWFIFPRISLRCIRATIWFLMGVGWVILYAHWLNGWLLLPSLEGKNLVIEGFIESIPEVRDHGSHFKFITTKINHQDVKTRLRLTWRNSFIDLHAGDEWRFTVRLKRIHGNANPGTFDYEAYAFQEGVSAQGYVVDKLPYLKLSNHWYHSTINQIREFLLAKIRNHLPPSNTSHWIIALCLGVRSQIPAADWDVLRATGTNHLMAIGGLHIGTMAALAHFVFFRLWSLSVRCLQKIPAKIVGAIASLVMTLLYSALSGFSIPAQRASLMLMFFLILILKTRQSGTWQSWSLALIAVLIINPLTTLTESFWLSFSAVGFIIFGMSQRVAPSGWWWKYGRVQWLIAIGLVPFSLFFFGQLSLMTFIANMIAIPWVAFGVVPLCVLGTLSFIFSAKVGAMCLVIADKILNILWIILTYLSHIPHAVWYHTIPHVWMFILAVIGVMVLLMPRGFPGRVLGIFLILPSLLYKPPGPKPNEFWLQVLDVGQGLAVVVRTQQHNLVFDTGGSFGSTFDMGASVVLPFLQNAGIKKLDLVVISHGDNDHIGGLKALKEALTIASIKTSVPSKILNSQYCLREDKWQWDGVEFEFLYPTKSTLELNNDSSCVLRISANGKHVLLTGDIEKFAERDLLANEFTHLPADVLIAPHHGSKTSGLLEFVDGVHPKYVIFATGYRNRYHFPHISIVKTYQRLGSLMFNTAEVGEIKFVIGKEGVGYDLYRVGHRHFWSYK